MADDEYQVPIDDAMKANMNRIAAVIDKSLPSKKWGFALFIFKYDGEACTYISSGDRQGVINVLRQWIKLRGTH